MSSRYEVENCQILVLSAKWVLFSNPLTYGGHLIHTLRYVIENMVELPVLIFWVFLVDAMVHSTQTVWSSRDVH